MEQHNSRLTLVYYYVFLPASMSTSLHDMEFRDSIKISNDKTIILGVTAQQKCSSSAAQAASLQPKQCLLF